MQRIARATLTLLMQPSDEWIYRRVERISFLDHRSAHHEVSVDFTLPPETTPIGIVDGEAFYVAPLFVLAKETAEPRKAEKDYAIPRAPYANLTLADSAGVQIPVITRSQSNQIAGNVLIHCAQRAFPRTLSKAFKEKIASIAATNDGRTIVREVLADHPKLARDEYFPDLAYMLATHSLVVCRFTGRRPGRSILKLSYDEPIGKSKGRLWERLFRSLGWKSHQALVALNEIGASATYRVEIDTPPELDENAVGLIGTRYKLFTHHPEMLSDDQREYNIQLTKKLAGENVYIPDPLSGRRVGAVWVKLRACRPGFLRSALAAAVINAVVLWTAAVNVDDLVRADRSEAAVALLLLLPVILAAYVARPDQHTLTTKILTGARVMLVVAAALPFAAALYLVKAPTPDSGMASTAAFVPGAGMSTEELNRAYVHAQQIQDQRARDAETRREEAIDDLKWKWLVLAGLSTVLAVQFAAINIWPRPRGYSWHKVEASRAKPIAIAATPPHPAPAPPPAR